MGTAPEKQEETVGVIQRAGGYIRLVERKAQTATSSRTRTLGDVIGAVLLVIIGFLIGRS